MLSADLTRVRGSPNTSKSEVAVGAHRRRSKAHNCLNWIHTQTSTPTSLSCPPLPYSGTGFGLDMVGRLESPYVDITAETEGQRPGPHRANGNRSPASGARPLSPAAFVIAHQRGPEKCPTRHDGGAAGRKALAERPSNRAAAAAAGRSRLPSSTAGGCHEAPLLVSAESTTRHVGCGRTSRGTRGKAMEGLEPFCPADRNFEGRSRAADPGCRRVDARE